MIIQYCADLHLEFPENKEYLKRNPLQGEADILLLGGDIVPFYLMDKYKYFFNYISDNYKYTYWIPGNHEYYHFDLAEKCGVLNEKIKSNVFLVNNTTIVHENVKFIFSTLWSKISPAYEWQIEHSVSDFSVIKYNGYRFSSVQFNRLHEESLDFIEKELTCEFNGKTIVLTHHVPTFYNYPEKYKSSDINGAFAVEMFDLIEKTGPDYWIYGHHHTNVPEFVIGGTKMLTNQLGYVRDRENKGFSSNKIVTIE